MGGIISNTLINCIDAWAKGGGSLYHISYQGRIFQIIWLPSFTQKLVVLQKTGNNRHVFRLKKWPKPYEWADLAQNSGFEFIIFLVQTGFKYFKRGQLPGFRHSAVVIIAPVRCNILGTSSVDAFKLMLKSTRVVSMTFRHSGIELKLLAQQPINYMLVFQVSRGPQGVSSKRNIHHAQVFF